MTIAPSPKAQPRREHLIDVAQALFNQHGFHQAGVDLIMRDSGVSKTTLYKYFPSKEDLVLEVLKRRSETIRGGIEGRLERLLVGRPDASPAERIGVIVDVIDEWMNGNAFHGCNFVRAAGEYAEPGNAIREQAKAHKLAVLALIRAQLEGYPEAERDALAAQIQLAIEGAVAVAQVGLPGAPIRDARKMIDRIIAA